MLAVKAVCNTIGCHNSTYADVECIFDTEAANNSLDDTDWKCNEDIHICPECQEREYDNPKN